MTRWIFVAGFLVWFVAGCAQTSVQSRGSTSGRSVESSSQGSSKPNAEVPRTGAVYEGQASYYSDKLAGRHTANGERYQPSAFTAAHLKLPFGTLLRVTRVDTGASVIVRVNDRGPYGSRKRILDLSKAAAKELDMLRVGVADVSAEVVGTGKAR